MQTESCPRLSGKVSTARLTKGARVRRNKRMEISMSRHARVKTRAGKKHKNDFILCTQTSPYRLAKLGTSLRVRGKRTLWKKEI